jgi:hypothetical protein
LNSKLSLSWNRVKFKTMIFLNRAANKLAVILNYLDVTIIAISVLIGLLLIILFGDKYLNTVHSLPSAFFITLGAMYAGILAITFALSLFSIQQAADKSTPTILQLFMKDGTNQIIFALLASFTVASIIFEVTYKNAFQFRLFLCVEIILIGSTFALLRHQYRHIAKMINPQWQIAKMYKSCDKYLLALDRYVQNLVKLRYVVSLADEDDADENEEKQASACLPNRHSTSRL